MPSCKKTLLLCTVLKNAEWIALNKPNKKFINEKIRFNEWSIYTLLIDWSNWINKIVLTIAFCKQLTIYNVKKL